MANADRIIDLLHEAKVRPMGAERQRFLAEACRDDAELKEQILSLLEADAAEGESNFLKITRIISPTILPSEKAGDRIGRYKLLEQIGEGGCGVVYVAEQEEPVRRRVALKVIKLGMDTKQVVARFDAERQALAMMDHPNIAKVLDGGATETGRPYFVMELVRGTKITDYCDQHQLAPRERVELFIQVCRAIQHAHQKGVMHRDIKPSNILVASNDGVPVPKVIDFGIAKATQGRLTDQTVYTAFEQFIGTPAYMSPEQAEMSLNEVDTRTDIYSLGVVLYELLTGKTPFDATELVASGLEAMRRTIREKEPARPSTRLSTMMGGELTTTARQRHTEAPRLIHLLRGDLDSIVMKCLEKDRTRRYETANGLAVDIQRHLGNEPVVARPPSKLYEFQKTVRRHKFGFAAAGAVVAALVLGLGICTWMFFKEKQARQRAVAAEHEQIRLREEAQKSRAQAEAGQQKAQTEAAKSQQVAQFLKDMLVGVGPWVAKGRDTTVLREIVDRTAERVGNDLTNQPEVEWELRNTLGAIYRELGEGEKAEAVLNDAPDVARKLFGNESLKTADLLHNLALAFHDQGKLVKAELLLREVLAMRRKLLGNENLVVAMTLHDLANTLHSQRKWAEAEAMQREALALARRVAGNDNGPVAVALDHLGIMLLDQGRLAEAEPYFRESLTMYRKVGGDENPDVAGVLSRLADVLQRQGKLAEAEITYREAVPMCRKFFGDGSRTVGWAAQGFAGVLQRQGILAEAEAAYREALPICRKVFGNESREVAWALGGLGRVLQRQGKLAEVEITYREAVPICRKVFGNESREVAWALGGLRGVLLRQDRFAEAEPLYREALQLERKLFGNESSPVAWSLGGLAEVLRRQGRLIEAENLIRESLVIKRNVFGQEDEQTTETLNSLIAVLRQEGKEAEAKALLEGQPPAPAK